MWSVVYSVVMENNNFKVYDKFKLKAVNAAKKEFIAAATQQFGVKHSPSNHIIFDECIYMYKRAECSCVPIMCVNRPFH